MNKFFSMFRKDEEGATAIEYGLIAALIAVALITALNTLGTSLSGVFSTVSGEVDTVSTNASGTATTTP